MSSAILQYQLAYSFCLISYVLDHEYDTPRDKAHLVFGGKFEKLADLIVRPFEPTLHDKMLTLHRTHIN